MLACLLVYKPKCKFVSMFSSLLPCMLSRLYPCMLSCLSAYMPRRVEEYGDWKHANELAQQMGAKLAREVFQRRMRRQGKRGREQSFIRVEEGELGELLAAAFRAGGKAGWSGEGGSG
jgi:hypothetical protein